MWRERNAKKGGETHCAEKRETWLQINICRWEERYKRGTSFKASLILGKMGSQIVCSFWGNFSPPTLTAVSPVTFKDAINNVWWSSLHAIVTWHVRALSQCAGHRGRRAHSDDEEHFKNKCIFKRAPFLTETIQTTQSTYIKNVLKSVKEQETWVKYHRDAV